MGRCDKYNTEYQLNNAGGNSNAYQAAIMSTMQSRNWNCFSQCCSGNTKEQVALTEELFPFHTINQNQSFRSMDFTSQRIKTLYHKNFACARTKTEAIICSGCSSYSFSLLQINVFHNCIFHYKIIFHNCQIL